MTQDALNTWIAESDNEILFAYLEKYWDHALESDIVSMMLNGELIPKDRIRWFLNINPDTLNQLGEQYKQTRQMIGSLLVRYIKWGWFETDEQRDDRVLEAYAELQTRAIIERISSASLWTVQKK